MRKEIGIIAYRNREGAFGKAQPIYENSGDQNSDVMVNELARLFAAEFKRQFDAGLIKADVEAENEW